MRRSGSCRRCGPNDPSIGSRCSTRPTRAWCGTTHRTTSTSLRSSWTTYSWFTPVPRFRPTGWCVSRRNWRSMSHCSPGSRSRSRRPTGGDQVRSGSIVVAGEGRFQATAVGADAYAAKLTAEARRYMVTYSELVADTNRLLRWISVTLVVVAPVLIWSQFRSTDNHGWRDAMTGTVAALVGMVPEGLVLLTSLAFVIATVSLARRSSLVQE